MTPWVDPGLTLELLPERIDLVAAVLAAAGLGALGGFTVGAVRRVSHERRALMTERFSFWTAAVVLATLLCLLLLRALL